MSNEHLLKKLEEVRETAGNEASIQLSKSGDNPDNYVLEVFPNDMDSKGPYHKEGDK